MRCWCDGKAFEICLQNHYRHAHGDVIYMEIQSAFGNRMEAVTGFKLVIRQLSYSHHPVIAYMDQPRKVHVMNS